MARYDEPDDLPLAHTHHRDREGGSLGQGSDHPAASNSGRLLAVLAVLVIVAAGGAWYLWQRQKAPAASPTGAPANAATAEAPPVTAATAEPALVLPSLNASDAVIRELLTRLSNHPQLVAWLAHEDLVRRFVATVDNLAEGKSPATHLRFLTPEKAFAVRPGPAGSQVIDPKSYARYDATVEILVSIPTSSLARLFTELHPLFDQAYDELGYPGTTFDQRLRQAMQNLLAVEVPAGPVAVKPRVTSWEYEDPALEGRSDAAKHLLRLGPANARRVQGKVRDLAAALGLRLGESAA